MKSDSAQKDAGFRSWWCWRAPIVFLVGLTLRLALLFIGPWQDTARACGADSSRIIVLARNLVYHLTYGKPEEDGLVHRAIARIRAANGTLPAPDANGLRPESFRPPGYPALLALFEATCDLRWALVLQAFLGAVTATLLVPIAFTLGLSPRASLACGLLWAIHPALVVYDALFLTESLFNAVIVIGLFGLARGQTAWCWAGSGLLLGVAGLVRPMAVLYEPLVLLLAYRRRDLRLRGALSQLLLLLLPSLLWAARNELVGEGCRTTSAGQVNLLFYHAAYSISEERGEDWLVSWPQRVLELSTKLDARVQPGQDVVGALPGLAAEELRLRPWAFTRVVLKSILKLFLDHSMGAAYRVAGREYAPTGMWSRPMFGTAEWIQRAGSVDFWLALGWMSLNAGIALAAIAGFVKCCLRGVGGIALACGATIVLFVLATGSVGLERMRLPIMVPLWLLAAAAMPHGVRQVAGNATTSATTIPHCSGD